MENVVENKKKVIAYLHTHWDREWYREHEVFKLRLVKVMDNVLKLLEKGKIPSFYFDGQVCALLDYLELRPEKEYTVKKLIKNKQLFIGPFYCLLDEFLTDGICFRKNLEIGMKIAKDFGCEDFIGYLADTFGHSRNVPEILKEFGVDKAVVWRGCPDSPSEFIFNGVNTVNLIRGYFMDIFSTDKTIEEKAKFLKKNLDLIAEKSSDTLLLPIGADHLGIPDNIANQIKQVNELLDDYEIELGSLFDYFSAVEFKIKFNDELRDNSKTFILPGSYSARTKLKRLNTICSYRLDLANKIQMNFGFDYDKSIEYAYKLLLENQAHDAICGCSTDAVHNENITKYNRVLQIANTIIEEIRQTQKKNLSITFQNLDKYKILQVEREYIEENSQVIEKRDGFSTEILYNVNKIPVTEDFKPIYTLLREFNGIGESTDLVTNKNSISNSNIKLEVEDGKINLYSGDKCFKNFIEFVRYKDKGDCYNYGPVTDDVAEIAQIKTSRIVMDGPLRSTLKISTSFFNVEVSLNKKSKLLNFRIKWLNLLTNKLWQVRFNFDRLVKDVYSEDMNVLIKRTFDPNYNIRENLPINKGIEATTNTAPFQRFAWVNGIGFVTCGITEYEVFQKTFNLTILRSIGIISNPMNPARTTPAGPPIEVPEAQQLGENIVDFSLGFVDLRDWIDAVEEIYPQSLIF